MDTFIHTCCFHFDVSECFILTKIRTKLYYKLKSSRNERKLYYLINNCQFIGHICLGGTLGRIVIPCFLRIFSLTETIRQIIIDNLNKGL